ncbi:ATP-binding protein [Salmonella sp. NCTC 11881]|nr:ATP-binding protein [Salmonella sp. NCTC 11881]
MRRGYAGELSLWVQHTLRSRAFDSIQKLDGAGQDALRTGQVIFAYQQRSSTGNTPCYKCARLPLAVLTYYVAGIAVMLWMSPSMTLIVICVLARPCHYRPARPSPCFSRKRGLPQTGWRT